METGDFQIFIVIFLCVIFVLQIIILACKASTDRIDLLSYYVERNYDEIGYARDSIYVLRDRTVDVQDNVRALKEHLVPGPKEAKRIQDLDDLEYSINDAVTDAVSVAVRDVVSEAKS